MAYEHMLDKTKTPTPDEILTTIGQPSGELWISLSQWIQSTYDVLPELKYGGAKYGWAMNYRKGGRAVCSLTPERGAFTALVVLGAQAAEEVLACLESFGPAARSSFENAHAFPDGRWLWIRVQQACDVEDIQRLLLIKRKPARKKSGSKPIQA